MNKLVFFLTIFSTVAFSSDIKVMSFNTMCDICKGSSYFGYHDRLNGIRNILNKHAPDLVSLQEIRSYSQVVDLTKGLPQYEFIASNYLFMSYADPTLLYNKSKFKLIDKGQFWLGPREGSFSLGWKLSLPRQVHWIKLEGKTGPFIFVGSHFDNRLENLLGAAEMVNQYFKKVKEPIIFAADTNLTVDMPEYKKLIDGVFSNSFDKKENFQVLGEYQSDKDICYTRKGKKFPECRVDHILLSKELDWRIINFTVDATKSANGEFPSDHRPVIISIKTEN
jgi:endonuclease/exonuclease/phosphatase family metal-dependent hydrolase